MSFFAVKFAQRVFAAPTDVGDPPAGLELDEVEYHGRRLVEILERDVRTRLARRNVAHGDIKTVDLPILSVDEGVAVELRHLAAQGGGLVVPDDQRREVWLEI